MGLSRTDLVPVLAIVAGGLIGVSYTVASRASWSPTDDVPASLAAPMTYQAWGLVAHYPLDGNADDASGSSRNGTVHGAIPLRDRSGAEDRAYGVVDLDYISLDADAFDGLEDFTFSSWVLFDRFNEGVDDYNTILSVASRSRDNELLIGYASDKTAFDVFVNQFFIGIDTEFGTDPKLLPFDTNTVVKDGEWHCITVVRSGSTATLYVDGSKAGASIGVPSTAIRAAANGAIIGQEQDDVGTRFNIDQNLRGRIDDVYVFDRALSESAVRSLYSRTSR